MQRQLIYLGSSQKDARKLPTEVQELFSYALDVALKGGQHQDAKPLSGFNGRSVIEVVGPTFRTPSAVRIDFFKSRTQDCQYMGSHRIHI